MPPRRSTHMVTGARAAAAATALFARVRGADPGGPWRTDGTPRPLRPGGGAPGPAPGRGDRRGVWQRSPRGPGSPAEKR
ncbi:hypothetical protein GCM10018793_32860 [Streptomyces sulfonofaciens]|uniref:Uncharacterized protein n=1 Tax=Streptomyces sulfonofaciens TaxID=68272 RepID=A0A919G8F5_9ACTN|nr:hypothetical protein GCM10018793_32860 [Streptomyces sulfonofaciens]